MVTATIKNEFQMAYKKKGPVLYVEKVENAEPPVEEMVYFQDCSVEKMECSIIHFLNKSDIYNNQ